MFLVKTFQFTLTRFFLAKLCAPSFSTMFSLGHRYGPHVGASHWHVLPRPALETLVNLFDELRYRRAPTAHAHDESGIQLTQTSHGCGRC
jgi:hypothetical protein